MSSCLQLRGYLPHDPHARHDVLVESSPADYSEQQAVIAELAQRKQELMYELASYANMRNAADRGQVGHIDAHACVCGVLSFSSLAGTHGPNSPGTHDLPCF